MDNFKFNFLLWGKLETLSLSKLLLPLLKILPCHEVLLVTNITAVIAQMICGDHLKSVAYMYVYKPGYWSYYSITNSTGATQRFSANHKTSSEQKNWSSFICVWSVLILKICGA